jgi:hypothetical protein
VTRVTSRWIRVILYTGADTYSLGVFNVGAVETAGRYAIAKVLT